MLEFARTACVLGESLSAELLSDVINVDVSVVNRSFSELNAIGLFDGKRARNEAALAALRAGIPTHERTDLHLRAAHVLQRKGAAAVIVARHLVEAGETNAPWMVDVLRAAAEQEAHDGDFALAVRCLRLARQAGSDAVERAQITSALGAAEWQLDPLTLVPLLPELVQAAQQGHLTAQQVGKVITYLLWHGQSRKATDLISAMPSPVNEGFGPYRPDDIRTQIQAWLYPSLLSAAPSSPTPGSVTLSATSLAQAILSGADVNDELLLTAEQVLLSGRLDDAALTTTLTALAMLLYADVLDHAAEWSNAWIEAADKRGLSTWSALFCAAHSIIDIRRGELSAGEAYARRALTVLPPRSWGIGIGLPLASALEANTIMGRYGKAASLLDIALPEEIFETLAGLFYMHARGEYHAAVGHPFTALADFQACGSLMREWGADHPGLLPWRGGAARAFQNLGRTAEAKQLAEEQLAMTGQNARARGASLRTLALLSEPQDRAALLTDAVAILETSADRVKLAAALADLSQTLTALGNHQAAQEAGRRASYLAKQCRAKPRLRTQQPEPAMRDRLQRERSRARLSDAEQRVAALAAAGYSNREIATELFITISTVEQHLTRVYRKLNVNRRPHLAKALASA